MVALLTNIFPSDHSITDKWRPSQQPSTRTVCNSVVHNSCACPYFVPVSNGVKRTRVRLYALVTHTHTHHCLSALSAIASMAMSLITFNCQLSSAIAVFRGSVADFHYNQAILSVPVRPAIHISMHNSFLSLCSFNQRSICCVRACESVCEFFTSFPLGRVCCFLFVPNITASFSLAK